MLAFGKAEQGFTLVEMMIVLVIAVIGLTAISLNISNGNQTTKLQAVTRDIGSALRYAHGQAMMTRVPISVVINLDNNSYQISDNEKVRKFPLDIDVSVVVAAEEYVKDGKKEQASIRFFADGSSTGGRVTLVWDKQLRRLDVNWITGEVSINDKAA